MEITDLCDLLGRRAWCFKIEGALGREIKFSIPVVSAAQTEAIITTVENLFLST